MLHFITLFDKILTIAINHVIAIGFQIQNTIWSKISPFFVYRFYWDFPNFHLFIQITLHQIKYAHIL